MSCNSNGRVNILGNNVMDRFQLFDKIPLQEGDTFYRNALNGTWQNNMLSRTFFCPENMEILHNGIRAGVYKKSNNRFLISRQDDSTLKIIMRAMFLQHAKNLPTNITKQVSELNQLVYDYAVPQILGEAISYIKYKNDVSMMHTPMQHPSATYNAKTLELKPWF